MSTCELCLRDEVQVTRHHLIPRAMHRKQRFRNVFERDELTGRIALLCRACHKYIHTVLSERELATAYSSIDQLRAHPEIAKFVSWLAKKPAGLRVPSVKKRF
jgi:predicted choloylglycine hydrolase